MFSRETLIPQLPDQDGYEQFWTWASAFHSGFMSRPEADHCQMSNGNNEI